MKAYKLINADNTVFAIFNDKDMANISAGQHFALRGNMLKMEEIEMPEIKIVHYDLRAQGSYWNFESNSIEQLKIDVMDYAERNNVDLNDDQAQSLGFGYDKDENEVFILEAL